MGCGFQLGELWERINVFGFSFHLLWNLCNFWEWVKEHSKVKLSKCKITFFLSGENHSISQSLVSKSMHVSFHLFIFVKGFCKVGWTGRIFKVVADLSLTCSFLKRSVLFYLSLFLVSEDKEKDLLFRLNSCSRAVHHDPVARRFRRKLILRQVN